MSVVKNLAQYRTRGLSISQDKKMSLNSDFDFPLPRSVPKCQIIWDSKTKGLKVIPSFANFKVHLHGLPFQGDDTTNTTGNGTQSTENTTYDSMKSQNIVKEFYFTDNLLAPKHEVGNFVGTLDLIFRTWDEENYFDKTLIIKAHHDLTFLDDLSIETRSSLIILLEVFDPGIDTIPKGVR